MKKVLFLSAAVLALLGASCSQDEVNPVANDGMTTLRVSIPAELSTRYGEAATAPSLYLAIYKEGTTDLLFSNFPGEGNQLNASSITGGDFGAPDAETNMRTATVSVPLVKGMAYDIICWAQREGIADYVFNPTAQTITVKYGGTTNTIGNYAEDRDAFFGQQLNFVSNGAGGEITLTRPFAQINVGTSDWAKYTAAGGANTDQFGMTIKGVANTLDLTNGTVTSVNAPESITVTPAATQAYNPTSNVNNFPAGDYTYLDMAYVLVNQNLTVGLTGIEGYPAWTSVPAKMNYRTNIYGDLLTNVEDLTITLKPSFGKPDFTLEDQIAEDLYFDKDSETYGIFSPEAYVNFVENFAGEVKPGETVCLGADLDMKGVSVKSLTLPWNPEGPKMTIDGQGHTISNLTLDAGSQCLFGNMVVNIKNLTIEGIEGQINARWAGLISVLYGDVENVHIKDVNIVSTEGRVGAIVGIHNAGVMRNCSVENVTVTGQWSVGGMIGAINETKNRVYENLVVRNVKVKIENGLGGIYDQTLGVLVGDINVSGVVFKNCVIEGCDTNLPIYNRFETYTWNGEVITKE